MGLTLSEYASAKMLPVALLRRLGVRDVSHDEAGEIMARWVPAEPATAFPYFDASGTVQFTRVRWSMTSTPMQPKGRKVDVPYGLSWLPAKRTDLLLCEGESDTQTLVLHDFPVLGCPGANNFKSSWASILSPYRRIYVWHEGDEAANGLVKAVSAVHPNTYVLSIDGIKDASALHLARPDSFRSEVIEAAKRAPKAEAPPAPPQARPQRRRTPSRDRHYITLAEAMQGFVIDVDKLEDLRLGRQAWLTCPFHSDSRPSLHACPETDRWYCFPCGVGGGVKDFLERAGQDWREVRRDRIRRAGILR